MQPGWRSKLAGLSELTGRSDRNVLKQDRSPMTGQKNLPGIGSGGCIERSGAGDGTQPSPRTPKVIWLTMP